MTIDDTLASFETIPDLPNDDEITVAELLQHTSGIADFANSTTFKCIVLPFCGPQDYAPATDFTPSRLVQLAAAEAPFGPPGSGSAAFHYSNTNYVILGMILEEVTGRTAEAVITEEVIEPLDLDDTVFPTSVDQAASVLTTRPSLVLTQGGKVVETDAYPVFNPSVVLDGRRHRLHGRRSGPLGGSARLGPTTAATAAAAPTADGHRR